ncbi:DUF488 domain-containing protein, partial [Candidatus Parcubacteria bacterium]
MPHRPLYTIGYGAREIDAFIQVLQTHGIVYLIDVRSKPYSRYKPEFSKDALQRHLRENGIHYVFMGDTLGGQPPDPDCYVDGKVDYDKCRQKPFFQEGLNRLRRAWEKDLPVVIMCSEGKPENCHRSKLIARALVGEGVDVLHIDEQDNLVTQEEVMLRVTGGQPSLFG